MQASTSDIDNKVNARMIKISEEMISMSVELLQQSISLDEFDSVLGSSDDVHMNIACEETKLRHRTVVSKLYDISEIVDNEQAMRGEPDIYAHEALRTVHIGSSPKYEVSEEDEEECESKYGRPKLVTSLEDILQYLRGEMDDIKFEVHFVGIESGEKVGESLFL